MVNDLIRYKQIIEQTVEEVDDTPVAKPLDQGYRDKRNFNFNRHRLGDIQKATDIKWVKGLDLTQYGIIWQARGSFKIPGGNFINQFNLIVPTTYLTANITHPPIELFAMVEYCYEDNDHPYRQKDFPAGINKVLRMLDWPDPDCTWAPPVRQQECVLVLKQEALTQAILGIWQQIINPA